MGSLAADVVVSSRAAGGLETERVKPELLAPAGNYECVRAAIENGADAVYFGLQAHNARARAANFDVAELPQLMATLHQRGVRGYVTLNTLAFPSELDGIERLVREIARSGVDAVIVQDLGVCRLIRALTPDLEIHASTQMSVTSVEGVELARELGCSRVILARELSLREIGKIRAATRMPLEVFVHGALCVAYSGQCLTSEALGARSANRGECAQACRMEYQVIRDGEPLDLGDIQYLLSPKDLAAFELVPQLVELGVASLKIEGRLKAPEYVASITSSYRRAIDSAWRGAPAEFSPAERQAMELTFSRGFTRGFLEGNNHKELVRGDYAKKRGLFLGHVSAVRGTWVRLDLSAPVKPGDGVVFDADTASSAPEQGGRVYQVRPVGRGTSNTAQAVLATGTVELAFGSRDIDLHQVRVGQRIWKTDDPHLTERLRSSYTGPPHRTTALHLRVEAITGTPLTVHANTETGLAAVAQGDGALVAASRHPASVDELQTQLGRLGGTEYHLESLNATIEGDPLVPRSLLNQLRRELVEQLQRQSTRIPRRSLATEPVVPTLRRALNERLSAEVANRRENAIPRLACLCRDKEQALAAAAAGVDEMYLDFQEIKSYGQAVSELKAHSPELRVWLAPPRVEKPGEAPIFQYLARQNAHGLLARNAGSIEFCARKRVPFVADFSLNAANELTVDWLLARGATRVTASYDLSFDQLDDLLQAVPGPVLEVVVHQHMPMFHMEHCVFCAVLSPGTNKTNCGRPCDRHDVKLRDRVGMEHPLKADVGCRNTLFNAVPQTAAEYLPRLASRGTGTVRIEFLDDSAEQVQRVVGLYRETLMGQREARGLWRDLRASNRYGVTRGQLAVIEL